MLEGYSGIGSPEITINGGNFSSTSTDENESSAIWSGNPNFKLTINGGELNGKAKDGIFIARRTWNNESDPFIGTLKITGGEITGKTHGLNLDRDIKSENAVEISGNAVLTGSNGSGLNLAGAPAASGAVTISGGSITGYQDGILYSKSVAIDDDGYGLTIKGGTITGTSTTDVYAHALNINTKPWRHSILIEDGTLNGGRDAIFVSQSGGGGEAVSITGGSIQGGAVSSGGCALWFDNNIDNGVFVISGGIFESNGGSAIATKNPNLSKLLRILPDGFLLTGGNKTYDGDKYFRDIEGISEITVSRS